jgi:hypothetical protein
MAFDSIELLNMWKDRGTFPKIHDNMAYAAVLTLQGPNVLDLCCSYGLLGRRILGQVPQVRKMYGIDADFGVIQSSKEAGLTHDMEIWHAKIVPGTEDLLYNFVTERQITSIVARRALPELFSEDPAWGKQVIERLWELGVKEWLIEGRVQSKRSTNALAGLIDEVELLSDCYTIEPRPDLPRNIAYLVAK